MVRTLLVRGLVSGLVAGLAAFLVGSLLGEQYVDQAIQFEQTGADHDTVAGHEADEDVVSRILQRGLGLLTATVGYGVVVGGLFGLLSAVTLGRLGGIGPRASAGLLALGGYVSVVLVPFLKYPASPPAVGDPDTINARTAAFFGFVLISIVLAIAAVWVARALTARLGAWNAWIVAVAGYDAEMAIIGWLLPNADAAPADFPATLLWDFRMAALVMQAVLWATLGLVFGYLSERAVRRSEGISRGSEDAPGRRRSAT